MLVRRYMRPALAVALEFASGRDDAEDVVQEAFHRALRQLGQFDERLAFRPWFFTIVRNLGRNLAARRVRWKTVPLPAGFTGDRPSPFEDAHRAEVRERLFAAIQRLPDMQRWCFRLCDMEGFTSPEVADMLGITPGTTRTHLHRARRALRQALRAFREEGPMENDD
jgi:RNA polymerase sigma-70 factor (ECF subfamily)